MQEIGAGPLILNAKVKAKKQHTFLLCSRRGFRSEFLKLFQSRPLWR